MKQVDSIRIGIARLILPSTHEVYEQTWDLKKWLNLHYPGLYVARKPGKRKKNTVEANLHGVSTGVSSEEKLVLRLREEVGE